MPAFTESGKPAKPILSDFESMSVLDRAHVCDVLWRMEEAERIAREEETGVGLPPLTRLPTGTVIPTPRPFAQ
jgi:hypothetical protein